MRKSVYFIVRVVRSFLMRCLDMVSTFYYWNVCKSFGGGSRVGWGTWIQDPNKVDIGENTSIGRWCEFGSELPEGYLSIGNGVNINRHTLLDYSGGVVLEDGVFISESAAIYSHSHGFNPRANPNGYPKKLRESCWVGSYCVITHGCSEIGENAVLATGSVVSKSVDKAQIVGGASCRSLGCNS